MLLPHKGGKTILTSKDVEASGINYDNLTNIPKATREMVLFRILRKLTKVCNTINANTTNAINTISILEIFFVMDLLC